jgi:RNA polymerase sigma factor (sigma-70 family)
MLRILCYVLGAAGTGWQVIYMTDRLKQVTSLFLAERNSLLAFIFGLVRDAAATEDIFQEVWLKLAEAAEREVDFENVGSWCRGVAKNLILHHWRSQQRSKTVVDSRIADAAERAFSDEETAGRLSSARTQALIQCVQSLPAASRKVLELKYTLGLPAAEVADRLQKTYSSVLMSLSRLRRVLADCAQKKLRLMGDPS